MAHHNARPRMVARVVTVALWAVGSAYIIKNELSSANPDWVVLCATPVVWAVVISLPILATYARRDGQWMAMALIWLAAIVGSVYTLQGTLGRQAEVRDTLVAKAVEIARQRSVIERDLADAKAMLSTARAKCGQGRTCLASTQATIGVYEGAVAGHEHRLSKLKIVSPIAGERRIAALLSFATGKDLDKVSEVVGLILPSLFGITLELTAFAVAMMGWHPGRKSFPVQFSRTVKPTFSTPPPKGRRTFRKDDAMADIVQFSRPVMQETLAARWNVTKAMVSMWLAEWEAMGIVDRRRIGKHKTVQSKKLVDFAIAA